MKYIFFFFFLNFSFHVSPSYGEVKEPLAGLKGRSAVVLLFSKSRSTAQFDQQLDLLREYRFELKQRDVIVLQTAGREETRTAIGYTSIQRGLARQLRAFYKPADKGLSVILIDKQGVEQGRWNGLLAPQELIDRIDQE